MNLPSLKIGKLNPKYPIIQGGMAVKLSTENLASAVANAGGIGLIAATGMTVDELKEEIRRAREKTDGIIGINIMYAVSDFKELVHAALDEGIDLIVQGAGFSRDIFSWCREKNTEMVSIVSSLKLARIAERLGASAVVVEGSEAGGHLGTEKKVEELLPKIKEKLKIPVIAAGGVVDSLDFKRVLGLGADGVQMGIRFAASEESNAPANLKKLYTKARKNDIVIIDSPVGLPGQAIKNEFTENLKNGLLKPITECRNCLKQCTRNFCIMKALKNTQTGNLEEGLIFSGSSIDKIKEILPAKTIIDSLVKDF